MKKLLPLVLALVLLCGCVGTSYPTAPTTPPTEAPDPTFDHFGGLGRICGVVADGDGYIFMTHTGLYRFNSKLERVASDEADDLKAINTLFDSNDPADPFGRMKANPDSDTTCLTALTKTSQGLMFFCYGNGTFYLNGEPWAKINGVQAGDTIQIAEYDGSIFTLIMGNGMQRLIRDGDVYYSMPEKNAAFELGDKREYTGMVILGGQLYVSIGTYSDSQYAFEPQLFFLVPVSTESEKLSYDGSRRGYGAIRAFFVDENGDTCLYSKRDGLLRVSADTTQKLTSDELGYLSVDTMVAQAEDKFLFLTSVASLISVDENVTRTYDNVDLTLGYIPDTPDYGFETVEQYFPFLANNIDMPGLNIFARAFESAEELYAAMRAGEIDLIGTYGLEPMQQLASDGLLVDLFQTNADLFEEDGLCTAVKNTFASGSAAFYLPSQLSVQALILRGGKDTNFWTEDKKPVQRSLDEIAAIFENVSINDRYTAIDLFSSRSTFTRLLDSLIDGTVDFAAGTATLDSGSFAALLRCCERFGDKELLDYLAAHPSEGYEVMQIPPELRYDVFFGSLFDASEYLARAENLGENLGPLPITELGSDGVQLYAGYYLGICKSGNTSVAAEVLSKMLNSTDAGYSPNSTTLSKYLPVMQKRYVTEVHYRTYIYDSIDRNEELRTLLDLAFYGERVTIRNELYESVRNALYDVAKAYFEGGMTAEQAARDAQSAVEKLLANP